MNLIHTRNGNTLNVKVDGKIDTNSAMEFGGQVNDLLDGVNELNLDFSNVEYISSLGLRAILELQKRMLSQGVMKIINPNQTVMDVFNMTGFSKILTIENA